MKNLINFFIKSSSVFLFLALEIFALFFVYNNKGYQRSVLISSTNVVNGWLAEKSSTVTEYFNLKTTNEKLSEENVVLQNRLKQLELELSDIERKNNAWTSVAPEKEYRYLSAKVIRNSTHFVKNYITLNKGSNDGIRPNMGVISNNAVVGIVEAVSPKFSKVVSLLHPISSISTKFKSNDYFGSVVWNGKDYRYAKLNDIARHVRVHKGDTLITSGLVSTFPEGVLVGTVNDFELQQSHSYYDIDVKLFTDFRSLVYVQVVDYLNNEEQEMLNEQDYGYIEKEQKKERKR